MEVLKNMTPLLLGGHFLLGVLIFICAYFLVKYINDYHVIGSTIARLKDDSKEREKIRKENLMKKIRNEGEQDKIPLFNSLDNIAERCGLSSKIPGFNGESLVISVVLLCLITFAVVCRVSGSATTALIGSGVCLGIIALLIVLKMNQSKRKIEEELQEFVDIMQNYSYGTTDFKTILKNTTRLMDEPLRGYLEECCIEMDATSSVRLALRHLEQKANHEQFKIMIDKLYISSEHNANYAEVIDANKTSLQQYFDTKESNKAITSNAKFQLVVFLILATVIFVMLNRLIPGFLTMLLTTAMGHMIIGGMIGIFIFGFAYSCKIEND